MSASPNRRRTETAASVHVEPMISSPTNGLDGMATTLVEQLPYALLVTVVGGRMVAHNAAAGNMFGPAVSGGNARCCELLGCGTPGSPVAEGCITRLALRERQPLAEVRLDLPDSVNAVWVMAAPLDDAGHVVIHLRPGMRLAGRRLHDQPRARADNADDFERDARAGLRAVERGDPAAEQRLAAALSHYNGEFLADHPYAEWARGERDRMHALGQRRAAGPA